MINPTLYSSTRQRIIHQHLTMFSLSFVLFSPKSGSTQYWLRLAQYSSRHRTDSPIMRSTAVHIFSQHWHWLAIIASQAAADSSDSVPRLYCVHVWVHPILAKPCQAALAPFSRHKRAQSVKLYRHKNIVNQNSYCRCVCLLDPNRLLNLKAFPLCLRGGTLQGASGGVGLESVSGLGGVV